MKIESNVCNKQFPYVFKWVTAQKHTTGNYKIMEKFIFCFKRHKDFEHPKISESKVVAPAPAKYPD